MADVWANLMTCHPRAMCHIARWKNFICHIEKIRRILFFCFANALWASPSGSFRIVFDTLVFYMQVAGRISISNVTAWRAKCAGGT